MREIAKIARPGLQRQEGRGIAPIAPDPLGHEIDLAYLLRVAHRQRWCILGCVLLGLAAGAYTSWRTTPAYQAAASIRIDGKAPNLPTVFRDVNNSSELTTETVVLRSRTLAEEAVSRLALQVVVTTPRGVSRSEVLGEVAVAGPLSPGEYIFKRKQGERFVVIDRTTERPLREVDAGQPVELDSLRFVLQPAASRFSEIGISILPFQAAVSRVVGNLSAFELSRDASIVIVQYEDEDRDLVWRVPNLIVDRYIAYRNEVHQAEARHSVQFLREQLDSVSAQLNTSEEALRSYRQRYLVISPGTEASSQVSQMAQLQAQRREIDTEREVLARLLAEADAKTARAAPEDPSPYRELLAFPTLMRSGAASDLLQGLARNDEERSALLARRTPSDPDVQALTERIQSLQGQIRGVVASYLESLSRQIAELDSSQARFGQQLSRIPTTELGLARLERKPKVLQEIYTLLQTRLQEAEIAQASEDPSVRRVDAAIPTYMPIRPRRTRNLFGGLSLGLMLGAAAGLLREARDKSVRSRADVLHATGMPVLGLIPQIPSRGKRGVMLGEWSNTAAKEEVLPRFREIARRTYTFLGDLPPGAGAADAGTSDNGRPKPGDLPRMVAVPEDRRPALEAYSALQTNLELVAANPATRVLLLTSPLAGEGKTTCAGNLALALAERGRRVLLIDVDLRQGKVHAFFDSPRRPGLAEVLTGALSLDDVCHSIELGTGRRLDYVTTGTPPTAPLALLESRELAELLAGLRERYETILLDSPPVNYVTDALLLSAHADGVIVVARSGQTEGPDLSFAMEQLKRAGAPVLGVALNAINFRGDAAYDRVYRYFVESPYGPAAPEE